MGDGRTGAGGQSSGKGGISRRTAIGLLGGGLSLGLLSGARAQQVHVPGLSINDAERPMPLPASPAVDDARIMRIAQREIGRNGGRLALTDRVGIVDFSLPSFQPRLFLVDMHQGRVERHYVTHGRGSDPQHDGWLKSFSNVEGSLATSRGAYRTGEIYWGQHGTAMRLAGLEFDNWNAEPRAIVVHSSWYADPALISSQGKLGRSEGCFVVAANVLPDVLGKIGAGRLLFADRLTA